MSIQTDVDDSVADLLGTEEYRKIRKVDDDFLDKAKQTGMRKIESASGNWLIRAFQYAKKIFAQIQAPDKEIYYAVPNEMVKEAKKETAIVVKTPKPRDPNYKVLANKRNAAGSHRDKKRDGKDGVFKHKKTIVVDEGGSKLTFKQWLAESSGGVSLGERGSFKVDGKPVSYMHWDRFGSKKFFFYALQGGDRERIEIPSNMDVMKDLPKWVEDQLATAGENVDKTGRSRF